MASPQKRIAEPTAPACPGAAKRARITKCTDMAAVLVQNSVVARSLVQSFLERSLAVAPDQRHGTEEALVGVVGDIIGTLDSWKAEAIEEAQAEVDRLTAEIAAADAACADQDAEAKKAGALFSEKAAVLESYQAAATAAAATVRERASEHKAEDKLVDSTLKERERLLASKEAFEALRSATPQSPCEKATRTKFLRDIKAAGKSHGFDDTMMETLPGCLQREIRGPYDDLCLSSFQESLRATLAELDERVRAGGEAKDARALELGELKQATADASQKQRESQATADEVQAQETAAVAAGVDAEKAGKRLRLACEEAERRLEAAVVARQAFAASTAADFEALKCGGDAAGSEMGTAKHVLEPAARATSVPNQGGA